MTHPALILVPNPVLSTAAVEVPEVNNSIRTLLDRLTAVMMEARGSGLAAPQIGVSERVIVVFVDPAADGVRTVLGLVNPVIVEAEGSYHDIEGCLSVPDITVSVKRAARVVVEALDRKGKPIRVEAKGHAARVLQHEVEHLDGITILKYATPVKRKQYLRRQRRERRGSTR